MTILMILAVSCVLYLGQYQYFQKHWSDALQVQIRFLDRGVQAGEQAHLEEVVTNAKRLALPTVQVKFRTTPTFRFAKEKNAITTDYYYRRDLFSIPGRKRVSRQLKFTATKRGYYTISQLDLLAQNMFLTKQYSLRMPNETSLYVYPYRRNTDEVDFLYRQVLGEIIAKQRIEEDLFAFRGLREYRSTDPQRYINWKSSARQGKLLVNMYETTTSQKICIIADVHNRSTFRQEVLQERVISISASLADRFLRAHIPVMVYTNGRDILTTETLHSAAASHPAHMENIDRIFARIDLTQKEVQGAKTLKECVETEGDDVCYLLITAAFIQSLQESYEKCQEKGINIFGVFVRDGAGDGIGNGLEETVVSETLPRGVQIWEVD